MTKKNTVFRWLQGDDMCLCGKKKEGGGGQRNIRLDTSMLFYVDYTCRIKRGNVIKVKNFMANKLLESYHT